MSYRELIYKNAFHAIEKIYEDSKSNKKEDLYRSRDIMNDINAAQMNSNQWLVDNITPFLNKKYLHFDLKNILILGTWYGVTGLLLREHIESNVKIWNVNSDPECERYSNMLKCNIPYAENNISITASAAEYFFDNSDAHQLIVNTSCESMDPEDLLLLINTKNTETVVCFQSNNYHAGPRNISTHNSVEEFVEFLDLDRVIWKGTLETLNDYERYMVIGL